MRLIIFTIIPTSFLVLLQDWSKVLGYLAFYNSKTIEIQFNKLKIKSGIRELPGESTLIMVLVVAFLGLAAGREAKNKQK